MGEKKRLPDSELEIMLVIWEIGEHASTSDIMARLEPGKSVQLVQNYLGRLEEKGFVSCEKIGRLNHYTPLVSLEDYRARETASFLERMYRNSPAKLFATLLEGDALTDRDIADIRQMLEGGDKEC